jgi:hypothetical protein
MYKLVNEYINGAVIGQSIIRQNADGTVSSFGQDPANTDYQEFLRWCEAGNEPLPPDSQE